MMGGGLPNPEASVALRGPSRVRSPQWDCVVPPTQFQRVFWPQALGGSGAEKGAILSGGRGDGREDRCGSGRFQTSISCAAQCSSQIHRAEQRVTPSKLSLLLALTTCRRMGCPVLGGGPYLPGLWTPACESATLFPGTRLSRAQEVLQCRWLTVKAGHPASQQAPAE